MTKVWLNWLSGTSYGSYSSYSNTQCGLSLKEESLDYLAYIELSEKTEISELIN